MADPLALAALLWAERSLARRPRIAGLGGEVARGFYYFGPPVRLRVRPPLSTGVERWRMFPNEAVETGALVPELGEVAVDAAAAEVHGELAAAHTSWCRRPMSSTCGSGCSAGQGRWPPPRRTTAAL